MDTEYSQWIAELAKRYRSSQIKASIKVNDEMLRFYWSVGEDIEKRQFENRYGSRFYENVSRDLRRALGLRKGLSPTTIKYTKYFYYLYSQMFENRQQVADELSDANRQHDVDDIYMPGSARKESGVGIYQRRINIVKECNKFGGKALSLQSRLCEL